MKNKKVLVAVVALALAALFFVARGFQKDASEVEGDRVAQQNAQRFVRDHSPTMGAENAKVQIVEFLDPECESCRAFYPYVKQILAQFPQDVELVIRYAPFHQNAPFVVKILEAARRQDKYWETLEKLFEHQPEWASHHEPKPELIWTYLPELGLDVEKLKVDMEDPKIAENLQQDVEDGQALGVRATPTFFVNGRPLVEFGPDHLFNLVQREVNAAKASE